LLFFARTSTAFRPRNQAFFYLLEVARRTAIENAREVTQRCHAFEIFSLRLSDVRITRFTGRLNVKGRHERGLLARARREWRAVAHDTIDPEEKRLLLALVADYERLAERAAQREPNQS